MAEITELKEKVRKAVTETRAAVKKIKTFETGIKTKNGKVVIRIPGRGLVAVAVPKGDLYFKDGAVKDSGVTNHKNAKWYKFTEPLHIKVGGNIFFGGGRKLFRRNCIFYPNCGGIILKLFRRN